MFGSLGFTELVLILIIVLIIFGAGKLPQLGEGVGKAIKGFKKSVHEADAIEAELKTKLDESGSIALRVGKGKAARTLALYFRRSPPPPHAAGDEPSTKEGQDADKSDAIANPFGTPKEGEGGAGQVRHRRS